MVEMIRYHFHFHFHTERMLIYYNPFSPPLSAVGVSSQSESLQLFQVFGVWCLVFGVWCLVWAVGCCLQSRSRSRIAGAGAGLGCSLVRRPVP